MKNIKIEFSSTELERLKALISEFQSYYEDEEEWSFEDLDNQRLIGVEIVEILENVLIGKRYA